MIFSRGGNHRNPMTTTENTEITERERERPRGFFSVAFSVPFVRSVVS